MKVEKVNIKELWFTEQLLYWNDIKDNKIKELEEENRKLKESLDIATKCSSKEEDWIIRLSEETKKLKEENNRLNELLNNVTRCSEQYREKMISVMEELKLFLYKE